MCKFDNGLTVANGRGYINERFDPETGLQYLHARYYDPHLGRFLSPNTWDPAIPEVDFNRYAHSLNDPINGSAPLGRLHVAELDANGSQLSLGDTVRESGSRGTSYTAAGPKAGQMQYEAMLNLAPSRLLTKPKALRPDPKLVEAQRKKEEAQRKKEEAQRKKEAAAAAAAKLGAPGKGDMEGDTANNHDKLASGNKDIIVGAASAAGAAIGGTVGGALGGADGATIGAVVGSIVGTVVGLVIDAIMGSDDDTADDNGDSIY